VNLISPRFHRLPLKGMAVFEAAARHGRFTGAAIELTMSQARVSQQISELESELGTELFLRRHRGVELTPAGVALLADVEQGLRSLSNGMDRVRRQTERRSLEILTDYGFATWWLMPRLPELNRLLPGIEVRIATTQAEVDATSADFDIAVMFGQGDWRGYRTTPIFPEEVYPVCAPNYLGDRSAPLAPTEIAAMRFLHLRVPAKDRWFTWADWLAAHRFPEETGTDGLAFDNFQLVLQAALLGQGACIGWTPLIDDLVAAGGLVRLTRTPLRSKRGYHVVEHDGRPERPEIAILKSWLLDARRRPYAVPMLPQIQSEPEASLAA
jgi:LysR family transcriptional regulator, glycine cleavage system transcriptional activator